MRSRNRCAKERVLLSNSFQIPPCPHCGVVDAVVSNERAFGWAERQWYPDGQVELYTDRVNFSHSGILRCSKCYKVRRDLKRDGIGITLSISQQPYGARA